MFLCNYGTVSGTITGTLAYFTLSVNVKTAAVTIWFAQTTLKQVTAVFEEHSNCHCGSVI